MGLFDRLKEIRTDAASEPAPASAAVGEVVERLRAFLVERSSGALAASDVDPREPMFDAGYVDSLTSAELLAFIDHQWGVQIADMDIVGRLNTLERLAAHVVATKR